MKQSERVATRSEQSIPLLMAEILTFGLLGKLLLDAVEPEQLDALRRQDVFSEIPFAEEQPAVIRGLALVRSAMDESAGLSLDEQVARLEADYIRLFVGPGRMLAPPWESTFFNDGRLLFQEETLQVRQWYRRYGLKAAKLGSEPDDHIALELRFLAFLAEVALEAAQKGDEAALGQAMDAQRQFLSEHVLRWVPLWCERVIEHASGDFYRGVAFLVRGTLTELSAMLGLAFPEVEKR